MVSYIRPCGPAVAASPATLTGSEPATELTSSRSNTTNGDATYQSLQGAFGRRALIEQAKGILMARHAIDADRAFQMLREHSQHNGRKLVDIAQAVVDSHLLLLAPLPSADASPEPAL